MKYEDPQSETSGKTEPTSPDSWQEGETPVVAPLSPEPEDNFDNSVFPHFWLCVPVALLLCWQFYDLFSTHLFFYRTGASGMYGSRDIIGPAWWLMPLLLIALLFFPFWNMRFAREAGDTKKQSLRRGLLTMGATFLVAAFIVWLLIVNKNWK